MRDYMAMECNMVIYVMTLILSVGRNKKWIMTLNLCLIPLKKILEINYTYGSLNILLRIKKILFIYQRMGEKGGVFRAK